MGNNQKKGKSLNLPKPSRKKTKKKKKSAPEGKLECPFRKKKQRIKETPEIEKIKEIPAFKEHERDTNLKEFGVLEASIWQ